MKSCSWLACFHKSNRTSKFYAANIQLVPKNKQQKQVAGSQAVFYWLILQACLQWVRVYRKVPNGRGSWKHKSRWVDLKAKICFWWVAVWVSKLRGPWIMDHNACLHEYPWCFIFRRYSISIFDGFFRSAVAATVTVPNVGSAKFSRFCFKTSVLLWEQEYGGGGAEILRGKLRNFDETLPRMILFKSLINDCSDLKLIVHVCFVFLPSHTSCWSELFLSRLSNAFFKDGPH